MGAPSHSVVQIPLPDEEGHINICVRSWDPPTVDVDPWPFASERHAERALETYFTHYPLCLGSIDFLQISETKQVVRCGRCGFRLSIPASVTTIGELKMHFKE